MDGIYILLAIIAVIAVYVIMIYNRLVQLRARAQNGFSQIDVQLKRRYDLIPNLVETAKGYLSHERATLEAVTEARNAAAKLLDKVGGNLGDKASIEALGSAETSLAGAMRGFNVAVEAYPDLKASQNMMQLSEELTSTENKVAFSRQSYNDSVNAFNEYRQSFPPIVFAGMFGFNSDFAFLTFAEGEALQEAPSVSF